jgi:hypothetical protein
MNKPATILATAERILAEATPRAYKRQTAQTQHKSGGVCDTCWTEFPAESAVRIGSRCTLHGCSGTVIKPEPQTEGRKSRTALTAESMILEAERKSRATASSARSSGFDKASEDGEYVHIGCSQCDALVVNGTPVHELGCPNARGSGGRHPGLGRFNSDDCDESLAEFFHHDDEPCKHEETDRGICLNCGQDVSDSVVDDEIAAAEFRHDVQAGR